MLAVQVGRQVGAQGVLPAAGLHRLFDLVRHLTGVETVVSVRGHELERLAKASLHELLADRDGLVALAEDGA